MTKADDPKEENQAGKEATDVQTRTITESARATTDTVGRMLHYTSVMNGGENA